MSYIYNGALSQSALDGIRSMMQKYPCPVELKDYPPTEVMDKLPTHTWVEAGDYGEERRSSQLYGFMWKNFNERADGVFVFFRSQAEKSIVLDACPDLVVDANPFKTVI